MQSNVFVRLALFAIALPVLGVWCACTWWWLVETFFASPLGSVFVLGLLAFACVAGAATWAIRGPWWFRMPTTAAAACCGMWVVSYCAMYTIGRFS